jgi:hypothetical protein
MNKPYYIGIDPGVSGGMVCLHNDTVYGMQEIDGSGLLELWEWINCLATADTYAAIEMVGGYIPKKGRSNNQPGSRMFTFGHSAGVLEAFLVAAKIQYVKPHPRTWQSSLGVSRDEGMSVTRWKTYLRDYARLLYPKSGITKATADATLLAYYAKKVHQESLG